MRYLSVKVVIIRDRLNVNIKINIQEKSEYAFIENGRFGDNKCNVMIEGKWRDYTSTCESVNKRRVKVRIFHSWRFSALCHTDLFYQNK